MEPRPLPSFTGFCIECHLAYPFLLGFTGFSTGFHVGYRVLLGFSLEPALAWIGKSNVTGFFLLGFTFLGFKGVTEFYWVFYQVSWWLPSFTGFLIRARALVWIEKSNVTGFFFYWVSVEKKTPKKTSPRVPAFFFQSELKKKTIATFSFFFPQAAKKKVRA